MSEKISWKKIDDGETEISVDGVLIGKVVSILESGKFLWAIQPDFFLLARDSHYAQKRFDNISEAVDLLVKLWKFLSKRDKKNNNKKDSDDENNETYFIKF